MNVPHPYWPLFDLRVRTPRLELRLPTDEELVALVALADRGVHDPSTMPFTMPWTDEPPPGRQRHSLQFWWRQRAEWAPERWALSGGVFVDGEPVGVQEMTATSFGSLRSVTTGSWLGQEHQGHGIGKEMRAAILHLAFAGLGAEEALSGAFADNRPSLSVSTALGYTPNGTRLVLRRGTPSPLVDLRLDRAAWERHRREDITIEGLGPCLELFGLPPEPGTGDGW